MKTKHVVFNIALVLAISGIWTIEEKPSIMGVISVMSIIACAGIIINYAIENWNQRIF